MVAIYMKILEALVEKKTARRLSIHNFRYAIVEIFSYNIHRLRNWPFNICIIVSNTNNVIFRYNGKLSLILVTTSYSDRYPK